MKKLVFSFVIVSILSSSSHAMLRKGAPRLEKKIGNLKVDIVPFTLRTASYSAARAQRSIRPSSFKSTHSTFPFPKIPQIEVPLEQIPAQEELVEKMTFIYRSRDFIDSRLQDVATQIPHRNFILTAFRLNPEVHFESHLIGPYFNLNSFSGASSLVERNLSRNSYALIQEIAALIDGAIKYDLKVISHIANGEPQVFFHSEETNEVFCVRKLTNSNHRSEVSF